MSEILKGLKLPPPRVRKYIVTIEGKKVEVTHAKKKEIIQHGEQNYMMKGGQVVRRPRPQPKTQYPILKKDDKGFVFEQKDIHWPNGVAEGGETWQIELE